MFIITNRVVDDTKTGLDAFGKEPNPSGPNELRMVEVTGKTQFEVDVLSDQLEPAEVEDLVEKYKISIDVSKPWYASLRVACKIFTQAIDEGKQLLLFVHGYNNDMEDVLKTANELEELYDVIVVPFSWPANGGGKVSGVWFSTISAWWQPTQIIQGTRPGSNPCRQGTGFTWSSTKTTML